MVELSKKELFHKKWTKISDCIFLKLPKAFKKLLLSLHPDKNRDDPDADAKFMELNEIYEVLKGLSMSYAFFLTESLT